METVTGNDAARFFLQVNFVQKPKESCHIEHTGNFKTEQRWLSTSHGVLLMAELTFLAAQSTGSVLERRCVLRSVSPGEGSMLGYTVLDTCWTLPSKTLASQSWSHPR